MFSARLSVIYSGRERFKNESVITAISAKHHDTFGKHVSANRYRALDVIVSAWSRPSLGHHSSKKNLQRFDFSNRGRQMQNVTLSTSTLSYDKHSFTLFGNYLV
jgi:hypothetical protein